MEVVVVATLSDPAMLLLVVAVVIGGVAVGIETVLLVMVAVVTSE